MGGTYDLVIPMGTRHALASLLAFTASMLTTWSVVEEKSKDKYRLGKKRVERRVGIE